MPGRRSAVEAGAAVRSVRSLSRCRTRRSAPAALYRRGLGRHQTLSMKALHRSIFRSHGLKNQYLDSISLAGRTQTATCYNCDGPATKSSAKYPSTP